MDKMQGTQVVSKPDMPWSSPADAVAEHLKVDPISGLSSKQAAQRLEQHGPNQIVEAAGRSPLRMFLAQFADLMIGLLVIAAIISASIGEWADSVLIAIIVVANAVIGFIQEWRAEKAVAALKKLSRPMARVWRDRRLTTRPAAELVPGDVIEVTAGDFVPADARLVECVDMQNDEAPLTGESLPVLKSIMAVADGTPLPDRRSMIYTGTAVAQGHGQAIITATGMDTELGHIASLLEETEATQTPLQQRLAALSKRLAIVVIAVAILIFIAGILREARHNWTHELFSTMLLTAVSLAVAAIPEGLPAVITVALSLGSQRMANRKVIIRRLAAVETLGSVNVICTDKTGTLTQNRMTVADVLAVDESEAGLQELLRAGVLCNEAEVSESGTPIGSATETAILQAAIDQGVDPQKLRAEWHRLDEIPFSSSRKRMATLHQSPGGQRYVFVKGAAEQVLSQCKPERDLQKWRDQPESLASRGRRVLAIAVREWNADSLPNEDEPLSALQLLGLFGIVDPIRPEARDAIARCRSAGIRPVMITGDHKGTAHSIAEELDLWREGDEIVTGTELDRLNDEQLGQRAPQISVYARVSPEHKLRIVRAHQSHGSVTAMTGDGVNDAPALKQASIGVAMGVTGTDVAKESADTVLADDNFATIVAAVEEGRVVYDNIRKFVRYLLTANAGEILVLVLAILFGLPLPLLPVHILWINLVTDGLPAIALGFEPAEPNIMQRRPRKRNESILGGMLRGIILIGLLMAAACVLLYQGYLSGTFSIITPDNVDPNQFTIDYARTMVFLTLSMFQLFYVLAIRSSTQSVFQLGFWSNYRLTGAVVLGTFLQLVVIYVAALQPLFHTVSLTPKDFVFGMFVSTAAFLVIEIHKLWMRLKSTTD
jgi:Ca2+-transporting ATPase